MANARELHFHNCIIDFVTTGIRLCKWNWTSTWNNFHYDYHCENYDSLTPLEVKTIFRNVILPKIFSYDLTYDQLQRIKTLNTYQACAPKLQRTEAGFEVVETEMKDIIQDKLVEGRHYRTWNSAETDDSKIATTLLESDDFNIAKVSANGNISIRKCLSLLLQTEEERMGESLLSWQQIKDRWTSSHNLSDTEDVMTEISFFEKLHADIHRHYENICKTAMHQEDLAQGCTPRRSRRHSRRSLRFA